jgi:hypothetical protein
LQRKALKERDRTHSQTRAQIDKELDDALAGIVSAAAAPARRPPGASPEAAPRVALWGPTSQRVTSPLQLLVQVADDAHRLLQEVTAHVHDITGEEPPVPRQRSVPKQGGGLLPAIGHIATEIGEVHQEIARLLQYVGGKMP